MADEPSSVTIPNLVQGVSQQAPAQRRDTQCEAQFDCINSPVEGCDSRPGFKVLKVIPGVNWTDRFFYDIRRSAAEHSLVIGGGGQLLVRDLVDGSDIAVPYPQPVSVASYMTTSQPAKDVLVAASVDDYTFIANREKVPAMSADISPPRPNEALISFRAGAYSTTYAVAVIFNGNRYTWTYTTPDNSVSGNAAYISTNQLAATFYRAMIGYDPPLGGSGVSASDGMGAIHGGDPAVAAPSYSVLVLNFTIEINGSVIRLWRDDGQDFSIDSSDGNGDTHLKALKGTVPTFADLPSKCFDGFVIKVKGSDRTLKDDYFVRYRSQGSGGYWEETIAPATPYRLNPQTMPYALVNTDYHAFTFGEVTWGDRVVGDAQSSKTPSFVGRPIYDLAYDNSRLAIVLEGSCVWSKSQDPYVFFTDTVQTSLDTAPVDYRVSGTRNVALLRRMVHKAGNSYLWAEQTQFLVSSGQEPFKEGSVEVKPSTSYEFAERCAPCSVAQSLFFANEPGDFTTILDLYVVGDTRTPPQDTDITAHIPKYIPRGVRWLTASSTLNCMVAVSDGAPNRLYFYNWLISENSRLQSAWNTWRMPEDCVILWAGIYRTVLRVLVQRGSSVLLLGMDLTARQVDPVAGAEYATRLDLLINDTLISRVYNPSTQRTTITLPYAPLEAYADPSRYVVIVKDDAAVAGGGYGRGRFFEVVAATGNTVTVVGDCTGLALYLGFRIVSERTDSEFYLRAEQGAEAVERLQVLSYDITHANTGYYRAEVTQKNGKKSTVSFEGRVMGDPSNVLDKVIISNGQLRVPVQAENTQFSLRLVNDSPFPSRWTGAKVTFTATYRARPRGRAA